MNRKKAGERKSGAKLSWRRNIATPGEPSLQEACGKKPELCEQAKTMEEA